MFFVFANAHSKPKIREIKDQVRFRDEQILYCDVLLQYSIGYNNVPILNGE